MNTSSILMISGAVALFSFTAILALAETSLVRTTKARALSLLEQKKRGARALAELVEDPQMFLHPIIFLVFLCQTAAATLVGIVLGKFVGGYLSVVLTIAEIVVVFVLAEALPKNWAIKNSDGAALILAPVILWLAKFWPLRAATNALIFLSVVLGHKQGDNNSVVSESELLALTDVALEEEVIQSSERQLIRSVIHFGDTVVREVMTPRPEIVGAEITNNVSEAINLSLNSGYSRLPVFEGNLDNILGVVILKDLVKLEKKEGPESPIKKCLREARFVPETKKVANLLETMQQEKLRIAIVVDEWGSVAGLVSVEDLVEELVGDIADEYEIKEPLIEKLSDYEFSLSGKLPIDEIKNLTGTELPEGDWDTVGGLLFHLLGHVPKVGEEAVLEEFKLITERVIGRRISRVKLVVNEAKGSEEYGSGEVP